MTDIRTDLSTRNAHEPCIAAVTARTDRDLVVPGALVRAGTRMLWEWVRVEAIDDTHVVFTRVMPSAASFGLTFSKAG